MNEQNLLIIYKNPERLTTIVNIFILGGVLNIYIFFNFTIFYWFCHISRKYIHILSGTKYFIRVLFANFMKCLVVISYKPFPKPFPKIH